MISSFVVLDIFDVCNSIVDCCAENWSPYRNNIDLISFYVSNIHSSSHPIYGYDNCLACNINCDDRDWYYQFSSMEDQYDQPFYFPLCWEPFHSATFV